MSLQFRCAILTVRQRGTCIFRPAKPAPAPSSLDGGNRCVTEKNFCRLISHMGAILQKHFGGVD
jgi:hypothetical protein